MVPVHRVSFWKGVLRDCLLRRRWVLKFLGKKRKRQLLRSLLSDPLPEGHPVDRDRFSVLLIILCVTVFSNVTMMPQRSPCARQKGDIREHFAITRWRSVLSHQTDLHQERQAQRIRTVRCTQHGISDWLGRCKLILARLCCIPFPDYSSWLPIPSKLNKHIPNTRRCLMYMYSS